MRGGHLVGTCTLCARRRTELSEGLILLSLEALSKGETKAGFWE